MEPIIVKLFNTPAVLKNNEQIYFSYKKLQALFYYLIVNKKATRDELVNLLWGEIDDEVAKKNLRNAMYQIRKIFNMDIIVSPQKSIVMLNPDINIKTDIDTFLNDESIVMEYGEFLKGFNLKNEDSFQDWLYAQRDKYKDIHINRLYNNITDFINKKEYDKAEKIAKLIIKEDEFDENGYRLLMDIYSRQGSFNKAIDIYIKLSNILEKELNVSPDANTKQIYKEILEMRNLKEDAKKNKYNDFFYGREEELLILKDNYNRFLKSNKGKSIMIIGEAGIGKTKLKDRFLDSINKERVYILEAHCYQAEKNYILKPWNIIFSKLSNIIDKENIDIPVLWKNILSHVFPVFNVDDKYINMSFMENVGSLKYQAIEDIILSLLKKISINKKIVLILEDLQWMDEISLSLLNRLILGEEQNNIIFISTIRNVYEYKIDEFISHIGKYNKIQKINLNRFEKKEVEEFSKLFLPQYEINKELNEKIYKESEGNTFFIVEILNTLREKGSVELLSSKIQDILKSRFIDISQEGKKLLNIACIFFDEFTIDILKEISGKDELDIMDIIEELENKFIIKEINDAYEIKFKFTHQKLREYIYINQSNARRRILHNKIALILEKSLKDNITDSLIYSKLIYHFSNSGNKIKTLEYNIKNIKLYLDFTHELFPIVSKNDINLNSHYISDSEIEKNFKEIQCLLDNIDYDESKQIKKIYISFYHMKARYLIRKGDYEQGIECAKKVIEKSVEIKDFRYTLKGYKQIIYYCIQVHDVNAMEIYIDKSISIAKENNIEYEIGILFRLKGLNKIMFCEYEKAKEYLDKSISIFESISKSSDSYFLNIAAAYNYIGEIKRKQKEFESAIHYYNKAIDICQNKKIITGLSLFNTNAGQAAFEIGDIEKAKDYFKKSIDMYGSMDSLWGRAISNGYMSLICINEDPKESLDYLKKSDEYSNRIKSPYEQGIVYRVKAHIKKEMNCNKNIHKVFFDYLNLSLDEYCNKGVELLNNIKGCYEIEIIKGLKNS